MSCSDLNFVSYDLSDIFNSVGINPLKIRVGIDLGYSDDVIWSHYGVPGCSELTTTSFHTDLAAKLQSDAISNGIYVGGNIKEILDIKDEFCADIKNKQGEIDYYIYQGEYKNYRKYEFKWITYLNSYDFTKINESKKGVDIEMHLLRLHCIISDEYGVKEQIYFQNSLAIKKDWNIKYSLMDYSSGNPKEYSIKPYESIEWKAFNSGKEAYEKNALTHNFSGKYNNLIYCETTAAYRGHHFVECKIKIEHMSPTILRFSIFVE